MNRMKPAVLAIALIGLAACSSNKEHPKLDYQTQNRKVVDLSVPPDLTDPNQGNRYSLPANNGAVRASDIQKGNNAQQTANQAVLQGVKGVEIKRSGNQRWLEISGKQPAEIWPLLKVFWQENGFVIKSEEPAIGQMETEWAENRAKIPQDGLRNLFEKVGLGGIYSTSERDKFTIRLERGANGTTDVFFVHKGMKEVYADKKKENTMWEPRPNDPTLEAAFLGRFMQYLGADQQQVDQQLKQSQSKAATANDSARIEGNNLLVSGDYQRNWRRTALALDRIGLTVLGQNVEKHAFLVQPVPDETAKAKNKKPGMLTRIFGKSKKDGETSAKAMPELIVFMEPVQNGSRISILNKDGSAYQGKETQTWLNSLQTELR
ncbi:MAG: outer membrane protein assembly factor BamC [Neisseria sp.]|uniref:outer membrane protein assembly factor BamC n=1 Tax=Neisseria sp. TaxID=192066 RepID=UPI0026DB6200|nr:outer membrane protein assembly factor BamC [Neisseria sp.]MDO4641606.1 outer membrane protein assembly factor BamC [Neisseria sp.]